MMEKGEYFKTALGHFIRDAADGGAIRHLTDLGYTAAEIAKRTTLSMSEEAVGQVMWEHLLDTDVIRFSPEEPNASYRIIKEQDAYGRTTFRRVRRERNVNESETKDGQAADKNSSRKEDLKGTYLPCNFGISLQNDQAEFLRKLLKLEERDREFILGLPWPPETVYYKADERMERIHECLSQ